MASFNLLSSNWLPVLFKGESQTRDVSIREALARAPDIHKLASASPLETVALHRLLLAILHRVFAIPDDDRWVEFWNLGRFSQSELDAYFTRDGMADRFDLFDPEHPFFQAPSLPESYATTIAKLGHEFSSGNNALLFDHSEDDEPVGVRPAAAARLLVAQQSFAVGGLLTRMKGEPPSALSSHLMKGAVILVMGSNLFETLVLNMVRVNAADGSPFQFDTTRDSPAWEREPTTVGERKPNGYLDLLTWQPRRVKLIPPGEDGLVRQVVTMNGFWFPDFVRPPDFETMVAYTTREKAAANQDPKPPVGFRPEQALWRDSLALLRKSATNQTPGTVAHLRDLHSQGLLDRVPVVGVAAFGLSSDRAKVFLWRHEEFPLPLAYLSSERMLAALEASVEAAKNAATQLRSATRRMAETALAPDSNADPARVRALVEALAPERAYWPALDLPFRRFMRDLAEQYDDAHDHGREARDRWREAIRRSASAAFERAANALATNGRGDRAAAEAASGLRAGLAKALVNLQTEKAS